MEKRKSRVLRKLRSGETVISFGLNLGSSRIAEIASLHGFDCVWIKNEHTAGDWSTIEQQINAAKMHDVDAMVRISRGSYSDYIKPLELDATGIMVPHIMSLDDAKNVVKMTRFYPVGRRPIDNGNADAAYCNIDIREYIKQANEQRFVMIQIEDFEAMEDLDAICALEGIDIIFFGALDYSHSLGAVAEFDSPELVRAKKRVVDSAIVHGKFAGAGTSLNNFEEHINMGFRFINIGGDVSAMNTYCKNVMQEVKKRN